MRIVLLLTLLLQLFSCAPKPEKETSTELIIGGAISSFNDFTGGLIVYGSGPGGASFKRILTAGNINEPVTLPNGNWTFYATGWEGTVPLSGNVKCSISPATLEGGDTEVRLQMLNASCALPVFGDPATKTAGAPNPLNVYGCVNTDAVRFGDKSSCLNPKQAANDSFKVILKDGSSTLEGECSDQTADIIAMAPDGDPSRPFFSNFPGVQDQGFILRVFDGNTCSGDSREYAITNKGVAKNGIEIANSDFSPAGTNKLFIKQDVCEFTSHRQSTPIAIVIDDDSLNHTAICTEDQFNDWIQANLGSSYVQYEDLDFTGYTFTDSIITGVFTGTYDGNEKALSNITINVNGSNEVGIFEQMSSGEIKKLRINNSTIISDDADRVGILVGSIVATGTLNIKNIQTSNTTLDINGSIPVVDYGGLIGAIRSNSAAGLVNIEKNKITNLTISSEVDINTLTNGGVGGLIGSVGDSAVSQDGDFYITDNLIDGFTFTPISSPSITNLGGLIGKADGLLNGADPELKIENSLISNLNFGTSINRVHSARIGGAVGFLEHADLMNSKVKGNIFHTYTTNYCYVGGAVGASRGSSETRHIIFDGNLNTDYDCQTLTNDGGGVAGVIGVIQPAGTVGSTNIFDLRSSGTMDCISYCGGVTNIYSAAIPSATYLLNYLYSDMAITGSSDAIGGILGHIISLGETITIKNGSFQGSINTAGDNIGGIIGLYEGHPTGGATTVTLDNMYVSGSIIGGNDVGGIVGLYDHNTGTLSLTTTANSHLVVNTTNITGTGTGAHYGGVTPNATGISLGTNAVVVYKTGLTSANGGSNGATVEIITGQFSLANINSELSGNALTTLDTSKWSDDNSSIVNIKEFSFISNFDITALGSHFDPFPVSTTSAWNSISNNDFLRDKAFRLDADLDFGSTTFVPVARSTDNCSTTGFIGTLFGNGHKISGATISASASGGTGIFEQLCAEPNTAGAKGAKINPQNTLFPSWSRGLFLEDIDVSSTGFQQVGIFTGSIYEATPAGPENFIEIRNVNIVGGTVSSNAPNTGSFAGEYSRQNSLSIFENIYSSATVENDVASYQYSGGLIGQITGGTTDSAYTILRNFSFSGTVDSSGATDGRFVGGIIGSLSNRYIILYRPSVINASILASREVGGIIGYQYGGKITEAYTSGTITATSTGGESIGGITGFVDGNTTAPEVLSSMSTMDIAVGVGTDNFIGGIFGNCGVCGNITIKNNFSYDQAINSSGTDVHPIHGEIGNGGSSSIGTISDNFFTDSSDTILNDAGGQFEQLFYVGTPSVYNPVDYASLNGTFSAFLLEPGYAPRLNWRTLSAETSPAN